MKTHFLSYFSRNTQCRVLGALRADLLSGRALHASGYFLPLPHSSPGEGISLHCYQAALGELLGARALLSLWVYEDCPRRQVSQMGGQGSSLGSVVSSFLLDTTYCLFLPTVLPYSDFFSRWELKIKKHFFVTCLRRNVAGISQIGQNELVFL